MKKRDVLSQICFAVVVALCTPVWAAERPAKFVVADKQMQTLGIEVAALQRQGEPVVISLPAQVMVPPNREHIISSPLAGLPVQLFVQQNQVVKQGTPLLRIVSAELGQLQLQLMQAASRAALARQAAQRELALFDEGIIPQRRVQETQSALKESDAALHQARAALRLAGLPAAAIDRVIRSGKLEDGLTLRATQAGIITGIEVKLGQRVDPTSPLMHLAQTDRLWLEIQAPAAIASTWQTGSKLKLQGRAIAARIVSVSPMVTAGSQTVAIRAELDSGSSGLRPGELVAVELPASAAAGWDVPLSAVAHDGSQAYVFVRNADGFEARPVTVAASAGQRVRIQGALKADDQIAVTGVVALKGSWLGEKGGS